MTRRTEKEKIEKMERADKTRKARFSLSAFLFTLHVYRKAIGNRKFAFLVFYQIVHAVIPTFTAILAGFIVTEITVAVYSHNFLPTFQLLIMVFLIQIARSFLDSCNSYVAEAASQEVYIQVSEQISSKYLKIPLKVRESKEFADEFEGVKNYGSHINEISTDFSSIVGSVAGLISILVTTVNISPLIAVVIIIASLPYAVSHLILTVRKRRNWSAYAHDRRIAGKIERKITMPGSSLEIEFSNLAKHLIEKMISHRRRSEEKDLLDNKNFFLPNLFSNVFSDLIEGIVLLIVAVEIIAGRLMIGHFLTIRNLFTQLSLNLTNTFLNLIKINDDLAYAANYVHFMSYPDPIEGDIKIENTPKIEFREVSLYFDDNPEPILKNLNFVLEPGKSLAIVGENGAGKSSIIKLLVGAYSPTAGTILVNDHPIEQVDRASFLAQVGTLFQDFSNFDFSTLGENVWYGDVSREYDEKAIRLALRKSGLGYLERKFAKGLRQIISKDIDEKQSVVLSGGEWQRLALARNFFRQPNLLILDEPLSTVDARSEAKILKEILKAQKDRSTIIISHRFSTVRRANHIIVMKKGEILEQGNHSELMAKEGFYKEMFELQAEGYVL